MPFACVVTAASARVSRNMLIVAIAFVKIRKWVPMMQSANTCQFVCPWEFWCSLTLCKWRPVRGDIVTRLFQSSSENPLNLVYRVQGACFSSAGEGQGEWAKLCWVLSCANLLPPTPFQESNYKSQSPGSAELDVRKQSFQNSKNLLFHLSEIPLNLPLWIEMS